MIRNFTPYA